MSRRCGGGGGRRPYSGRGQRPDSGRGQRPDSGLVHQPSSHAPSFSRGGDGRRGRGRGRGRGQGFRHPTAAPPAAAAQPGPPMHSMASAPARTPALVPAVETSASVSESLSRGVERLELEPKASPSKLPPESSKAVRFPARPGYGAVGEKCLVRANHFLVQVVNKDLHHYDVAITPGVTSKKLSRHIMDLLVKSYGKSDLGERAPAYDGRKSLYTVGPLPFESKEFLVELENKSRAGSSDSKRKERQFNVAIKLASRPDLHYLQEFLCRRHAEAPQETIQALDVVLRDKPSTNCVVVGRSFFSPDLKGHLGDGIGYCMGYYQSLRPTQMGLSLNIDISARSFYEPILVTDFILKHFNRIDLSRPLSGPDSIKLRKTLKGVKVEPNYLGYPRTYKVSGISKEAISQIMFTLDDTKTKLSVVQYFREKYDIPLKYTSLPAIQAGSEAKPVYLPMELCRISEGQRYTKKLNEKQVMALLNATCQRPLEREQDIKKMVENNFNDEKLVKEFGIQVAGDLALVDARVLPPPMLKYHENGDVSRVNPSVGQWNMIDKKMVNGGRVDFWTCINFTKNLDLPPLFCRQLVRMCNSKGMVFYPEPVIPITNAPTTQIEASLVNVYRQSEGKLQLLIIILPYFSGSYGKIKRICETELGIVTQCCKPQRAFKLRNQYLENVSLKINVKVGGRNTVLNDAVQKRIPFLTDRPTIIFGADVTHPQPGEDSSPSIAAVVASMDWPEATKYRTIVAAQAHREEIIQDLYKPDPENKSKGIIWELLLAFYRSVGEKPRRIIFYRDGVGEGQFSQVLLYEVDAIRKACAALEVGYMPPVTFIVVQKRHHTRLFPVDHNRSDRSGNILPGTVVDTKICHPTGFDFYLNSHAGIQGTSRPTHYHVLYDENGFKANDLQILTNNLCYTYARCTRSVSIVPPAYYAHLAAARARYYIEDETSGIGSSREGRRAGEGNVQVRLLPSIKENVQDVMFYC